MKKILISGASGMVGYSVCNEAMKLSMEVVGFGREDRHRIMGVNFLHIDITDFTAVAEAVEKAKPDLIVHLAANTNLEACERDPESARRIHVQASEHLARIARNTGSQFVHASTEAVYGYLRPGCKKETDECRPIGVYATTKLEAEERVILVNPEALVLRITPVGLPPTGRGHTLAEWLLHQFRQTREITGYEDVFFTPISSASLARLILSPKITEVSGIYNWGIDEVLTKYDFARRLAEALDFDATHINPIKRSPRGESFHGEMDSRSLSHALHISQPSSVELFEDLVRDFPPHQSQQTDS